MELTTNEIKKTDKKIIDNGIMTNVIKMFAKNFLKQHKKATIIGTFISFYILIGVVYFSYKIIVHIFRV